MPAQQDVTVNLPKELLDSLSEVLRVGLEKAKIPPDDRKQLTCWWDAEAEFIREEQN